MHRKCFLGLSKIASTPPGIQQPQFVHDLQSVGGGGQAQQQAAEVQYCGVVEDDPFGSAPFSMPTKLAGTTVGGGAGAAARKAGGND